MTLASQVSIQRLANYYAEESAQRGASLYDAKQLLTRIHAAMIRCRWHEPTGMDEDKDSALNLEREVREWLGVKG